MGIAIRRTIPDLSSLQLIGRAEMREAGLLALEMNRRRTAAGKDADGQPFEPYSEGYRERKAREVGGALPNLTLSGAMLNALTIVDVTDDSVTIGFSS
jgi:hypothetical protein